MPTKVAVNTEQIAISDGSSFLVTARDGTIDDQLPQGFFVRDTRLISYYEISLSIFFFIRTMLGLEADAPHQTLRVNPVLPEWLRDLVLTDLVVGSAKVDLHVWREGEQTRWEVTRRSGELNVSEA